MGPWRIVRRGGTYKAHQSSFGTGVAAAAAPGLPVPARLADRKRARMVELQSGTQVRHASLGQGKVVAAEAQSLHVFFPAGNTRFATKLRLPEARRFLRLDGFEPDGWLDGLSAFEFDAPTGRYALTSHWLSQAEAVAL